MMNNTFKIISRILFLTITIFSCSTEIERHIEENALKKELKLDNKGVLEIDEFTYVFKESGKTIKFQNDNRKYDYQFVNELNYKIEKKFSKTSDEEYLITNPKTDEFIKIYNFEDLKGGTSKFDIETSSGLIFKSVIFNSEEGIINNSQKCPWCAPVFFVIVNALVEVTSDDLDSNCNKAIDACADSGGKPSVTLEEESGWFSTKKSCSVECK